MYRFPTDDGVQFGLRVWIVFILLFWLLRYRAELAILLGAVAGAMAGILMTYWRAQKLPNTPPPPAERPDHPLFRVPGRIAERFRRSTEKNNLERQSARKSRRRHLGKPPNWKR
jgi:hypothetical protein